MKATWVKAIANNQYASWLGLTVEAAERHFPESLETQKGHMRKQNRGRDAFGPNGHRDFGPALRHGLPCERVLGALQMLQSVDKGNVKQTY